MSMALSIVQLDLVFDPALVRYPTDWGSEKVEVKWSFRPLHDQVYSWREKVDETLVGKRPEFD